MKEVSSPPIGQFIEVSMVQVFVMEGDQNINICTVTKCGKDLSLNIRNSQKHIYACQSKYNSKNQ